MKNNENRSKEEQFDIVDEDDKKIGTLPRSVVRKKNLLHRGVIFFVFNKKGELYIPKRSDSKDILPGKYDISVGGGVSAGETYREAAGRELLEELGIKAPFKFIEKIRYKDDNTNYFSEIYALVYDGEIRFNDGEVVSGRFMADDELMRLVNSDEFVPDGRYIIRKYLKKVRETVFERKNGN